MNEIDVILKQETTEVSDLLSDYINLHTKIQKQSGTFTSTIKNFFSPIDYEAIYQQIDRLVQMLDRKQEKLITLINTIDKRCNIQQKDYLDDMSDFFNEVRNTAYLLRKRQYLLLQRSRGKKFLFNEFRQLENQYQQQAEICGLTSKRINSLVYQLDINDLTQQVLETPEGDFWYPGTPEHVAELERRQHTSKLKQQDTVNLSETSPDKPIEGTIKKIIGIGNNKQSVLLRAEEDGTYSVMGRRLIQDDKKFNKLSEMSREEIYELCKDLSKAYKEHGHFRVKLKVTNPKDLISPIKLILVPKTKNNN